MLSKDQIRVALVDRNLAQVARQVGVTPQTMYNFIRTGSCSLRTLERLSKYLEGKL